MELRHHEQADALAALGRIGQAGQHQVHDVGSHVVLASADEDLVAGDLVGAVGLRLGLGAQQAQVGAAVGFGQAHGAGPLTAGQLGQVQGLLLFGAVGVQGFVRAVRQAGVHGPGLVGRVHHLVQALVQHEGQALAAVGRVARQCRPAAFDVLGVGILEARGGLHFVGGLVEHAAFGVAADVQREGHFGSELAGFFEHRIDGVHIHLGVGRHGLEFIADLEHFVHDELHVAQGRRVHRHGVYSLEVVVWLETLRRLAAAAGAASAVAPGFAAL
ncbi:hypothetical protein D3C71_1250980 [compost metagenome]